MGVTRRKAMLGLMPLSFYFNEAEAAKKKPVSKSLVRSKPLPIDECKPFKGDRVRADVVADLETGHVIFSNMTAEQRAIQVIHPASLTKLEPSKTFMIAIRQGLIQRDRDITVNIWRQNKMHQVAMKPLDILRGALNLSLNVMDSPSIATADFIAETNRRMRAIGMTGSNYVNATGLPFPPNARKEHVTTVHDLLVSIIDFEQNYARPEKVREFLGQDMPISGIWKPDIPGFVGRFNTFSLINPAAMKKVIEAPRDVLHENDGIIHSKTGTTCNAGSSVYFTYKYSGRPFLFLTLGHDTGYARDRHAAQMIRDARSNLDHYLHTLSPPSAMRMADPASAPR